MVSATAARGRGEDRPTRLARPEGAAPARTATSVSHAVMQFVVTGLVALALVAVGTTLLSRQAPGTRRCATPALSPGRWAPRSFRPPSTTGS